MARGRAVMIAGGLVVPKVCSSVRIATARFCDLAQTIRRKSTQLMSTICTMMLTTIFKKSQKSPQLLICEINTQQIDRKNSQIKVNHTKQDIYSLYF